jgi:hypothetical protein
MSSIYAQSARTAPLHDADTLRTIFLEFTAADSERELTDFYNSDADVPVGQ